MLASTEAVLLVLRLLRFQAQGRFSSSLESIWERYRGDEAGVLSKMSLGGDAQLGASGPRGRLSRQVRVSLAQSTHLTLLKQH
jgi:hypothetical protein